ncbi:caspase family protein [Pseudomonas mosselii]|uniref:NACHT and WD repeat domain-containing protein n=1 Tax=Pseudomonas mosselii TaxID=78327 RepID=UPI00117B21DF|nr:NACHT and WD repeat domain-containing protein [Pseudomonas mosselii]MDH1657665.1 caspase family protein [Pseudomonas mosselii]MDH1715224.1 caspase family protein [Pseudomonas mosselii]MDH1719710.1 caspase family protein [Pseudomonas mosselii]
MDCDNYNRRLLTAGRATFEFLNALDGVEEELETVADAFSKLNYKHAGNVLDPDRATLEQLIQELTAQSTKQDLLVIYYTGHADSTDRFYLLASDSRPQAASFGQQAIPVEELTRVLIGAKASQILLILDVCQAGLGALESVKVSLRFAEKQNIFPQLHILASAMPKDVADERAFSKALAVTLENPDYRFGGVNQRYLAMDEVIHGITQYLRAHFPAQEPLLFTVNQQQRCLLFPNPHFDPRMAAGLDLASQRAFEQHWLPKARGVEPGTEASYFTGRQHALDIICDWLKQPSEKFNVLVVTGGAGTGKSALLARLVTLADVRYAGCLKTCSDEMQDYPVPRPGIFDSVVHARSKFLINVVQEISSALGDAPTDDPEVLLSKWRDSERKFNVVIDALDESPDADAIVLRLLKPMIRTGKVFLLLGTRPDSVGGKRRYQALGFDTLEIDLNSAVHIEQDQVARYVYRRLMASEEPDKYSPYRGQEQIARKVGDALARRAGHVFLVAHTAVLSLLLKGDCVDTSAPDWEDELPDGLDKAFNQFLSTIEPTVHKTSREVVKATLRALAFAQGEGLPWAELWTEVAGALSGIRIDDADIVNVRQLAAPFIVEAVEDERSVYRLYHEQLAEYLRGAASVQQRSHALLWDALVKSVPANDEGRRLWHLAHPHFKRHLASYASKADRLGDVLGDPALMLSSDPVGLRRHLKLSRANEYPLAEAYLSIYGSLRDLPEHERPGPFACALLQRNLAEAKQLEASGQSSWMPVWSFSRRPDVGQILARRDSPVTALGVDKWEGEEAIALIGRADGLIEVIRLDDGMQLATWHPIAGKRVNCLSTMATHDGQILVMAGEGGILGAINLRTGSEWFASQHEGKADAVKALALVEHDGRLLCATAHESGRHFTSSHHTYPIRIWALQGFEILQERQSASRAHIFSLAFLRTAKGLRLLSGGCTHSQGKLVARALTLWDMSIKPVWRTPRDLDIDVESIELHTCNGSVFAAIQTCAGAGFLWKCLGNKLEQVYQSTSPLYGFWAEITPDRSVVHVRTQYHIQTWRVDMDGMAVSSGPSRIWRENNTQTHWSQIARIDRHGYLLSANAGAVSMWPLPEEPTDKGGVDHAYPIDDVIRCAFLRAGPPSILYCGVRRGLIIALDVLSGIELGRWVLDESVRINGISGYDTSDGYVLLVADGRRIWQIDTNETHNGVGVIEVGQDIWRIEVVRLHGRVLIFAAINEGNVNAVRIFDALTRKEVDTFEQVGRWSYQLSFGEEDKPISSLDCMLQGNEVRTVFASKYSKVMVAEYPLTPMPIKGLDAFKTYYIPGSATARVNAIAQSAQHQLIAAGTESGAIAIWRWSSGERVACKGPTHSGDNFRALAFCEDSERVLLAGGSENGALRFWDGDLQLLRQIELGAPVHMIRFLDRSRIVVVTRDSVMMIGLVGFDPSTDV